MNKSEPVDAQTLGQKNSDEETQTNVVNPMDASLSGLKHAHQSGSSYYDKEQFSVQQSEEVTNKQLIVVAPLQGEWTGVKSKKKGKKGKLEDFFNA